MDLIPQLFFVFILDKGHTTDDRQHQGYDISSPQVS